MEKRNSSTSSQKDFGKTTFKYSSIIFIILFACYLILNVTTSPKFTLPPEDIFIILLVSFIIGIVLAYIRFAVTKYRTLSRQGILHSKTIEDNGIFQTRSLTLPYNYDMSFFLCMESVSFLKHAYVKKADPIEGIIKVRVGMSWKSLGENITFHIKPLVSESGPQTLIKIESRPAIRGALYDYGKNRENVETITHFLNVINKIYFNLPK